MVSAVVLAIVATAFFLAGTVKGIIGMGLPTVSIGVMSLVMRPSEAAALLIAPSIVTNVWQFWAGPHARPLFRRLWPTMAGLCVGTWLTATAGFSIVSAEAAGAATTALGVAIIAYAVLGLIRVELKARRNDEIWLGPLAGLITGAVSAVTGIFVIPMVPYFQAIGLQRDDLVQAQGLGFTVATLALAATLISDGALRLDNAGVSAFAILPAILGMMAGQWIRLRIRPEVFRACFYIGMLLLGGHLVLAHR